MTEHDTWNIPAAEADRREHQEQAQQRLLADTPLDDMEREEAVAYYGALYATRAEGPQLEGLMPEAVDAALQDPRTIAIELSTAEGQVTWPLFVPVEYNTEYRAEFFDGQTGEGSGDRAMYFSDPGEILDGSTVKIEGFTPQLTPIVYEVQEGDSGQARRDRLQHLLFKNDVVLQDYYAGRPEIEHPKVVHFAARTRVIGMEGAPVRTDLQAVFEDMVRGGQAFRDPANGATILRPEDIASNKDGVAYAIWKMYHKQFDDLIKKHPSMQEQPRPQLMNMLADPRTLSSAFYENEKIVGLLFLVQKTDMCGWLAPNFYKDRFPGENMAYFPGIVVDEAAEGRGLSLSLIRLVSDVMARANLPLRLLFQCTEVSAQYVPRIVKLGVNRTDNLRIDTIESLASYRYEVLQALARGAESSLGEPDGVQAA